MRKLFFCIDVYICGNFVRLVVGGGLVLKGNGMGEKRLDFLVYYDWIRIGFMFELCGYDMMLGSIFYELVDLGNDVVIFFIEISGCLLMCGYGIIGMVIIVIEEGLVKF